MRVALDRDNPAAAFESAEAIYLLSHSVGRLPRATEAAVREHFFDPWRAGADEPWPAWMAAIESFRLALARLFNSPVDNFCPQTNLSGALSRILGALPPPAGRETILLSEDDFPSTGFVMQQAQRLGYRLRYLPAGADVFETAVWLEQLDDSVGTVFVTHVQSNSGKRAAVEALLPELRRREIISIVDVAQSAGVMPIDLDEWGADFVIGSCVKWLCGGPGAGYLWANPGIIERCQPLDIGWFSHENPFEFDIHDFRYHPSALRFWGGTPSVLPCVTAATGIDLICQYGVQACHEHNRTLRSMLLDGLDAGALVSPEQEQYCGGTIILNFGERQGQVAHALLAAGVAFDVREAGMRLSPHLYNTVEEMESVVASLTG